MLFVRTYEFVATSYRMSDVLPVLAHVSKLFQKKKLGLFIASSAGISSCHFQSYTISSSSNTNGKAANQGAEGPARASAEQREA